MRASALKYAILTLTATLAGVVLLLMPLHAFLTVWGDSIFGHYTALRLWKEVLLVVCLVGVSYLMIADNKIRSHTLTRRLVWLILLYSLLNFVAGLVAYKKHDVDLKALGYGLIVDLRFPAFFLVTWAIALRTSRLRAQYQRLILWPALLVVAFGLLQVFVLPHNFLTHFGYGPKTIPAFETINSNSHYIRIESTLRGANPLGAYLLIPITYLSALIVRGKRSWQNFTFLGAAVVTLYFTFSRSAWVGAVLSIATVLGLSLRSRSARQLAATVVGLGLILLTGVALGFRHNTRVENIFLHTQTHSTVATNSDQGHASALKSGLHDVVHQPLGKGPGSAGPESVYNNHPARIAEDYFIQVGQETGWLGLVLFLLINVGVGYLLWSRRSDTLALSLFASLIGISFINLLSHAWADDTLAYVWWGLAGIAMVHVTAKEKTHVTKKIRTATPKK
jgi:hypothetical protein